jgi:hypothetical protein
MLSTSPGFTAIPAANFDAGNAATDTDMKALRANAEFGAVRNEQFWGFYKHGETVNLPVSPADGYAYARNELLYSWSVFWTGSAAASLNGTQSTPTRGATSGSGELLQAGYIVDQATGLVTCDASYFKTSQMNTNDGILLVIVHAQRNR